MLERGLAFLRVGRGGVVPHGVNGKRGGPEAAALSFVAFARGRRFAFTDSLELLRGRDHGSLNL